MKTLFIGILTGAALLGPPTARANLADARIALHLQQAGSGSLSCDGAAGTPCSQFSTSGDLNTPYFIYLVLVAGQPPDGFTGAQFGLDYEGWSYGTGLYLDAGQFIKCSVLSFESNNWPAPGTGITLAWPDCQQDLVPGYESEGVHTLAGVFRGTAYGADRLDIVQNPIGYLSVVGCNGSQVSLTDDTHLGSARFTAGAVEPGHNPCTDVVGPPPPPPPPPPGARAAAIMLHLKPTAEGAGCNGGPATAEDIVTTGAVGEGYFVYLLAQPPNPGGLAGLQFGLEYPGGAYTGDGLGLFTWSACTSLSFPGAGWPASGSGVTVTWDPANRCQTGEIAVAGFCYAYAYTEATLAVAPYPTTGLIKAANCAAAEIVLDTELGEAQVGWVSLGGAARAGDADGCNPALEPCLEEPVTVRPTTWSAIKANRGGH